MTEKGALVAYLSEVALFVTFVAALPIAAGLWWRAFRWAWSL